MKQASLFPSGEMIQCERRRDEILPPLKWAGGKRWILPYINDYWKNDPSIRLVEPFVGGLSVSLGLMPTMALLNDINPHLINFYTQIKGYPNFQLEMVNTRDSYYLNRGKFNDLIAEKAYNTKEAAELFYYLNRTCYNGLCRFNKVGKFNVPFGQYKTINYQKDFSELSAVLKNWSFTCMDYVEVLENSTLAGDFIYADPPYDVEFTKYYKDGFSWDQQVKLANLLRKHNGPVIASNQATSRIVELYSETGFNLAFVDAPRRISCTGDRTPAKEMIATRNLSK